MSRDPVARTALGRSGSQSAVRGPAASVSPGNVSGTQILRSDGRRAGSGALEARPGLLGSPGVVTAEERRSTACGRVAVAVGSTADERHGRVPLS